MNLKLFLFYSIGFLILYLEPISMGGLTFGILWKLVLMFLIVIQLLLTAKKLGNGELFVFFYMLLAFKMLFNYSIQDYPIETITLSVKTFMFPLLYLYFLNNFKKETLLFFLKHYAILIILSFVPYILGILTPMGVGYDLSIYGHDGEQGLVGPFLKPHSASISLAFAMIVVTAHIKSENSFTKNLFYIGLIILGFYALIETYVRTGIVIYLVALLYFYLQNINMKKIILIIVTIFSLAGAGLYLMQTSDIVKMRLEDKNIYVKQDEVGSGRFTYWRSAVENWLHDEPLVILVGLGEEYGMDKMLVSAGMRIFAHNEFFQMLQQEGLIGFSFFLLGLFFISRYISRYKYSIYHRDAKAVFLGMITMMLFQGGFYFNIVFFLSIYLVLLKLDITNNERILA